MDRSALLFLFFLSLNSYAQKYAGLSVDNDLYFLSDYYYSSGVFLEYGMGEEIAKEGSDEKVQVTRTWILGQEINNPSNRHAINFERIDYPYNGWLFLGFNHRQFKTPLTGKGWGVQVGLTGDASLGEAFQNLYHKYVLNLEPLAWVYQQPQALHINVQVEFLKGFQIAPKAQFTSHSMAMAGTFRSTAFTRFGFQTGNVKGLPFYGNRLPTTQKEWAFYVGMKLEYRFHDYAISGSLFGNDSNQKWEAVPFKNGLEAGVTMMLKKWRIQSTFHYMSKDVKTQRYPTHKYLNISIFRNL